MTTEPHRVILTRERQPECINHPQNQERQPWHE
jgi:hypothetical protein